MADWKTNNLLLRILSAIVGIPLIIIFIYLGGAYLIVFIEFVVIVSFYEYLKIQKLDSKVNIISGLLVVLTLGYLLYSGNTMSLFLFIVILPVSIAIEGVEKAAKVIAGVLYISLLSFLFLIRNLAIEYVLSVVIITWVFDIFSYFGGITIGKHKLAPMISPKKSYEGLLTGLVMVLIASMGLYYLPLVLKVILGISIAFAAFAGDLIESKIKRLADIKDSGGIIPGHGGFLDRFDSLILSAPVGYFLIILFIKLGYL